MIKKKMNDQTGQVIKAIADDMLTLFHQILANDTIGANRKSGKNTLRDSSLQESIKVVPSNNQESIVIEAFYNNYLEYIEHGRKPKSGKQPPISAIHKWAQARGIPTDNSTLYMIAKAIWRDGYEPRPILATLADEVEKRFEEQWAEQLFEAATDELTKYFN